MDTQLRATSAVGIRQLEQSSRTNVQPTCLAASEKKRYELVYWRLASTQCISLCSPERSNQKMAHRSEIYPDFQPSSLISIVQVEILCRRQPAIVNHAIGIVSTLAIVFVSCISSWSRSGRLSSASGRRGAHKFVPSTSPTDLVIS